MTTQSRGSRAKWLRVAFVLSVAIAAHVFGGSSAQAAAIDARQHILLAGSTAQRYPVVFRFSGDGKTLMSAEIALSMSCASGATLVWGDSFVKVPVHANGRLHASYASPTILTNGTASSISDALTARFGAKHSHVTGTWQLAANFTFSDGTTDRCDSGPVAFSATT